MGIEAATSTTSTILSSSPSKTSVQKSSTGSFKEEMKNVKSSENEGNEINNTTETKNDKIDNKKDSKTESKKEKKSAENKSDISINQEQNAAINNVEADNKEALMIKDINLKLSDNILRMVSSNINSQGFWSLSLGENSTISPFKMNEDDAQFFINLTQNEEISVDKVAVQAQEMISNGANIEKTQSSAKVSQTLLDALQFSREKNQPVRIDFDRNVSVIIRVSQNGAISAHFVPGDKAVEQYLKNNIDFLKNTFDEKDLPYTDLSYSHSSKEQNQRRRNEQQGD